ncbi:AMP-binding protein [Bacillus sp. AK128]
MKVYRLIKVLYNINLLSPLRLFQLVSSIRKNGVNLLTLLHFAEKRYGDDIALVEEHETFTYKQLRLQSDKLSIYFHKHGLVQSGQKVAFLCKNHASLVKSIFAVSRLGADLYLLNAEMSSAQFNDLVLQHDFDLIIYDNQLSSLLEHSIYRKSKVLSYHQNLPAINNMIESDSKEMKPLPKASFSKIILQTSGTTGKPKAAAHQPSLFNYLNPFVAFIKRLKIMKYHTAYIASPIYHGYGIAVLLLFIPLGKKVVINSGFEPEKACKLIQKHEVEVVTVVPLMLQKMLNHNPENLKSLACIASGGAKLSSKLVNQTFKHLGPVLYNLYGTSESGLNFIATPEDLMYSSTTIGKEIEGMTIAVLDKSNHEVKIGDIGQLCIKNDWSKSNRNSLWIQTGDLVYRDKKGYYFLCGRNDDMVVSGGENVYPIEVEQVLIKHPFVEDVAIIGINDDQFGQRLKAFVLPAVDAVLTEDELLEWMRSRVARFQMPKTIEFVDYIPYTAYGKLDKTSLRPE